MIIRTKKGLYCPDADFYIDPNVPVDSAIISHGHADHVRIGHRKILCSERSKKILEKRFRITNIQTLGFGKTLRIGQVAVTLYPASHILGASQVKIETKKNGVWLYTGDFRIISDESCDNFEFLRTDTLVSESTFGLPVFQWPKELVVFNSLIEWWKKNIEEKHNSIIYCYSLGKAQRILVALKNFLGEKNLLSNIYCHNSTFDMNEIYVKEGIRLPTVMHISEFEKEGSPSLILMPPRSSLPKQVKRKLPCRHAMASGWMQIRGYSKREFNCKRLVLSDHADWNELNSLVMRSSAENIFFTHGFADVMAKYLSEKGLNAVSLAQWEK